MAETKAKKAKKASTAKKASKAKAASAKSRKPRKAGARSGSKPNPVKSTGEAIGAAGKDAGQATGEAVRKARLPLLAGGAAIAGTVGGVVLGATRSGGKVLGVKLPAPKRVSIRSKDIAKAAKEIGRFGENVGDLTTELRRAREGLANGNGHHNSPIEVLLRGLTNRR
jgi:hypothetical protein